MGNPSSFMGAAALDQPNTFTGDQTITGALAVTGNTTLTGDLTVTGRLTATGGADYAEVRAATTANITLSGAQTIDGVSVVAGNRVLVKNQSTASQNGLYLASASAWSRAVDLPTGASAAGLLVIVQEGTVNADITFLCTSDVGSDVVGTNNLVFASGAVVDSLLVHKAGAEELTGRKTFAAGLTVSTAQTVVAGSNTLVGTVADKINPVHIAHASQAIGDLLVADGATTMTRLADVATGQVLKSGGVGAPPVYGAIGGTTAAAAPTATAEEFAGTGFTTAGQVVTTSTNQTMAENECAGMWFIAATQAPCLIESNTAVTGAPAVLTVYGLAPTTDAGTYKILRGATHTHGGTGLT